MSVKVNDQIRLLSEQLEKIDSLEKGEDHDAYNVWHTKTELLMKKVFDSDAEEIAAFQRLDGEGKVFVARRPDINAQRKTEAYFHDLKKARGSLTGIIEYLKDTLDNEKNESSVFFGTLQALHTKIQAKCSGLYSGGHYSDAVDKGFRVVRDRLRELTKFEKGQDAFSRGNLYIKGGTNEYVDEDFQEAVKFLAMAIDRFRNEKVHTSDANIEDPVRAYEYLSLSSLAMHLLDDTEIREKPAQEIKSKKTEKVSSKPVGDEGKVGLDKLQVLALRLYAGMTGQKELYLSRTSGGDRILPMEDNLSKALQEELQSIEDMQEFEVNLDQMASWGLVTVDYGKYNSKRYKLSKFGYDTIKEYPQLNESK